VNTHRLALVALAFGAAGFAWGLAAGGAEAWDSAVGTGILGLAAGVLVAACLHAGASWRRR